MDPDSFKVFHLLFNFNDFLGDTLVDYLVVGPIIGSIRLLVYVVKIMHFWSDLILVVHQIALNFLHCAEDGEASLCPQNFLRMGFLSLSQFLLSAYDTNPIEIMFLMLSQIIECAIQKCRVMITGNCLVLISLLQVSFQAIRQHVANMQNQLIWVYFRLLTLLGLRSLINLRRRILCHH